MPLDCSTSIAHQRRAHAIIPGAAHTYAKGDDQFPEFLPPVIRRGHGCHVTDLDGNTFIEYGSGLRAITLGHGVPEICDAAYAAMRDGTNFARPSVLELQAAEKMLELVPNADMVKFAKHGSDCTTAAVKLARHHTGRGKIAICRDDPFYSVDDWFIATTPMDGGIPGAVRDETVLFPFNDLPACERLFAEPDHDIAAIMLEGQRGAVPEDGFLHKLRDLAHAHGALFILDETIAGFRLANAGAQQLHDIEPDLSTFGKAMANGFSVSALCGKRQYMAAGGIDHDGDRTFLLSTTHGAESHGLAAFMATVDIYQRRDVPGELAQIGERLCAAFDAASRSAGTGEFVHTAGHPANAVFVTRGPDGQGGNQPFRTLFMQEFLKNGVLAPSLVVNTAHGEGDGPDDVIDATANAAHAACSVYRKALDEGVEKYLEGRSVKPVFRRRC
ncbi:MAG: glutamate-1-semialdehyde 2,1-aminomutase [Planctomycetota bacterium]